MKKTSLAEIMGKGAANKVAGGLKLEHLPEILGDAMPEMPRDALGRHRLIRSLKQRFGDNWRSLPGVNGLVKEFESEIGYQVKIAKLKAIKAKG